MATPSRRSTQRALTARRSVRLYRLLKLLADRPTARPALLRRLKLDLRGFYRDLERLRALGIVITLVDGKYALTGTLDAALALLPLPDPQLTIAQALQLAKGRTDAHLRLRKLLESMLGE